MARASNPVRRFKDRHKVTYPVLAQKLGISEDYARKLGAGLVTSVSPEMAKQFERRTAGEIRYLDMMRWTEANLDGEGVSAA